MSKKHGVVHQHVHDATTKTVEQLVDQYGIEIDEDTGEVWDPYEMKTHRTLMDWAREQDAAASEASEDEDQPLRSRVGWD